MDPLAKYSLDDELKTVLTKFLKEFPGGTNAPQNLDDRRKLIDQFLSQFPPNTEVSRVDHFVDSKFNSHKIPIRFYRPLSGLRSQGVILKIHGGGMVMGSIATDDGDAARLSTEFGVTVIALDYRLAPEYPFPIPVEDCISVASWILSSGKEIDVDVSRSVIYGGSAGGGLAIATAMALRDRLSHNFNAVVAPYPMVDYRNTLPSTYRITDLGVWDRQANLESWNWYVGDTSGSEPIHPLASPLHAENLGGLPNIFIDVGSADLFFDEDIQMVARLVDAGVNVEFHSYPGAFHASEMFAPEAALSKEILRARFNFMRKIL